MPDKSPPHPVIYQDSVDSVTAEMLKGFFEGWPNPPTPQTHLKILQNSAHVVLAIDGVLPQVIGFATALSDGVSCAYIPHLEVLKTYRGCGIGSELIRRLLKALNEIYMIDLICDPAVEPFYERLKFRKNSGMILRNYHHQSGLV